MLGLKLIHVSKRALEISQNGLTKGNIYFLRSLRFDMKTRDIHQLRVTSKIVIRICANYQGTKALDFNNLVNWEVLFYISNTVYPKTYAHGFCFAVLCCGYTLTDFPISIRFTSLALWQSNDCPSASKATLMNMDKYFMWIHYERLHNHNKAKQNKTVCIFFGIYCIS